MIGAPPQSNDDSASRQVPWFGLAVLAAALTVVWAIASAVAYHRFGSLGLVASSIAAVVCFVSAAAALATTALLSGQHAVHGVLLGVLLRTGLPLAAGIVISLSHRPLAQAGVFGLILIHYLVALAVETPLAVREVRRREALSRSST